MNRYLKPCFDTSVFLGGLNNEIANGIKRRVILDYVWAKAEDGEFPVLISAVTIAEAFKRRNQPKTDNSVLDEFLKFIEKEFVQVIEVDREVALHAHQLCRQYTAYDLRPNDAIHLACAIRARCDVLLAWDGPLVRVSCPDIRIEEPCIYDANLATPDPVATAAEIRAYEEKRSANSA